jgi:hypothetical protein
MRQYLIKLLGGYPDFDSALEALKDTDDVKSKNALLTEATKKLFNTIGADDILRVDPETKLWVFQGKTLSEADMINLREEAKILRSMKLWRVLKMDIRYQLNRKMFEESRITMDLVWGKLILWLDDVIRTRLQTLK